MKKLLLIDGMNLLFRSYYATAAQGNLMKNSAGTTTNAVYGFVSAFQQILQMPFSDILVAFDAYGPTHRHLAFEEYKGTRKAAPDELIEQIPIVKEYLDAQGVARYELSLYEADDIIGHMAKKFEHLYDHIQMVSNDRDLFQLLSPKISQLVSKKGFSEVDIFTPAFLMEKMGIRPDQMPDYKGLVGDTSDNIPGVPGIGDKTAVKLLQEYDTLENIIANAQKLTGKLAEKMTTFQEQARFSKQLATITTDFENGVPLHLQYDGPNFDLLRSFYQKMEFHSHLRRLEQSAPKKVLIPQEDFILSDPSLIPSLLVSPSSIHLELFGDNYHTAQKLGIGVKNKRACFFVPYDVFVRSVELQNFLKDPSKIKHVYDWKSAKVALLWDGFDLEGVDFDLKLAAYLLNPNNTKDDFRVVASSFDFHDISYDEEIYGKGAKHIVPDNQQIIASHVLAKVRAIDSLTTVANKQLAENGQTSLFEEIELPLSRTLAKMEFSGISIDPVVLDEFGKTWHTRLLALEQVIYDHAGETFNINSPKQLGSILFETLNLPYYKKTKSGYSTDVSVLQQLDPYHPIIRPIMEYRTLSKLYSTYYEGLKNALEMKQDGKIHTIYQQTVAQTGRLSSIEPNLQNIPIRSEEGKELRKIFVPKKGHTLLSYDYSQIELRVLAQMGNCHSLKDAFLRNEDIHTHTARLIFQTEQIHEAQRRQAKAINFGIIYGKTPWGLSDDLQIPLKQAELFIQHYFENFPEIKAFMDLQIQSALEKGYVETLFHRRRYIPEVKDANYQVREFGKRMAMNAPIQGTAADVLKIAMVRIQKILEERRLQSEILLQIHDELVFDVLDSEAEEVYTLVKDAMEHATNFEVPLRVEGGFGQNLFEVK